MKIIYTGLESSGKSYILASIALDILDRNKRWLKKTNYPRTMAFDSPMSQKFIDQIEGAGLKYMRFRNLSDILPLEDTDIFIGEVLKFFPAAGSNPLTQEQMDFVTQGAKSGVFIYGASQDFSQVHKQFRLLVNEVHVVTKLCGSHRPIKSRPKSKHIWGLIMSREVEPHSFRGESATMEDMEFTFPDFYFIRKKITDLFDTSFKVPITEHPPMYVRKQKIIGIGAKGDVEYQKEVWKP